MPAEISLEVPSIAETMATGLRLSAEKMIHRVLWRVEFWNGETYPRLWRGGVRVSVAQCPEHAARFANQVRANFLVTK